ncbi:MAG: DUF503 domain-containing protein [Anaerolineales bacterium]
MSLGLLTLHLSVPGCMSLKEKRSRLKPLLARLHREFNVSVAEMDRQDSWQNAVVACAMITSNTAQTQRALQGVVEWVETHWPDLEVTDERIEII